MRFDPEDLAFLDRRKRRLALWPAAGAGALLALLLLLAWLVMRHPLLIDPTELSRRLATESIDASTITLMAGMLPFAVDVCLLSLGVALGLTFIAFRNERRHIALIESLARQAGGRSTEG